MRLPAHYFFLAVHPQYDFSPYRMHYVATGLVEKMGAARAPAPGNTKSRRALQRTDIFKAAGGPPRGF